MNPFQQALSSGYSITQILSFVTKAFPALAPKIQQARAAGHSIESILDFVAKTTEGGSPNPNLSQSQIHAQNMQRQEEMAKGAVKLGASALGTYALGRALPAIVQQIAPGLTGNQPPGGPQPQGPMPQMPGAAQQVPQGTQAPIPGGAQAPQPTPGGPPLLTGAPSSQAALHANLMNKMGLGDKILALKANRPEDIAAALEGHFMSPNQKKWLKEQTVEPLSRIVTDFLGAGQEATQTQQVQPGQAQIETQVTQLPQPIEKQLEVPITKSVVTGSKLAEMPKVEAKKLVVLSGGKVGEVESERNGIAKINVDGEIKHRKLDETIESPLPEKDLADLYNDVISGIEKESGSQVSRNVYWAGYDPKTNELIYIPHGGKAYVYEDISPEDKENLTNVLSQRKSSGENYLGTWGKGTKSPIGAAMYQLIQKLQKERGGKGNEYKNRFETIYDALELAKTKAKEKYEKSKTKKAKKPRIS